MSIFDAFPRTPIKITRDFSPRKFQKFSKMKFVLFVSLEIQYNYFLAFRLENLAPTPSANPHRARRGAGALFLPPQIELD